MAEPKRMEYFNTVAGLILAKLYEAFPVPTKIHEPGIADALGIEKTPTNISQEHRSVYGDYAGPYYDYGKFPSGEGFFEILWSTLTWLRSEGIIRAEGEYGTENIVLTAAGLEAMKKTPAAFDKSLGDKLVDATKDIGKETGKSVIASTVGEILGGFVKGIFS